MPVLSEPSVSIESVRLRKLHLTSVELDVTLVIRNQNPVTAVLREFPFRVYFRDDGTRKEVASGNTGKIEVPAGRSVTVPVIVTSGDLALAEALLDLLERGNLNLEIEGDAVIDHIVGWTIHITERVDVTTGQVLKTLEGGSGKDGK